MKNKICLILTILLASCANDRSGAPATPGSKEVEIAINTAGEPRSRTPVPDEGTKNERIIQDLDLLVFGSDGGYLYRREAFRLTGESDTYRASLVETKDNLTIHLLANCRDIIKTWEDSGDMQGLSWDKVHAGLIDSEPWRLVGGNDFQPLPMWGTVKGNIADDRAPTKLGPVAMLRSVASVDLYVEMKDNFVLTGLHPYYAPDMGYVGAEKRPSTTPLQYAIPKAMATTVGGEKILAKTVGYLVEDKKQYETIANQTYLYDNDGITRTGERRPTRIIMAGFYNGVKGYYPIDIVDSEGKYRPLIRNWKYKLTVTSVNGPGQPTIEEAAVAAQADLNVKVIIWNRVDVEIGVASKYYVSMERKDAILWRNAGSTDRLKLTYRIEDDGSDKFEIKFRDDTNGVQKTDVNVIENDYFRVTMNQSGTVAGGTVDFTVEALKDFTAGHDSDYVEISFRNLRFGFTITQITQDGWENGGLIPAKI